METIHQVEIIINFLFQSLGDWLRMPMQFFSLLGAEDFYMLVLPILYWCFDARIGLQIGIMLMLSGVTQDWLKVIFATPRPYWEDLRIIPLLGELSFGLPSGHALNSAGLWGLLAGLIRRKWFTWLMVITILLIGLSRIYLGVHYLSDVIAGWLVGLLLVLAFLKWQQMVSKWVTGLTFRKTSIVVLAISLGILVISFSLVALQSPWNPPAQWIPNAQRSGITPDPLNPNAMITLAGTFLGLGIGAAWMHHRNGLPKRAKTIKANLIRYMIGIAGTALIWFGLSAIFPKSVDFMGYSLRYLRYALVGLWVSGIAPWVFILIEKPKRQK